YRVLIQDVHRLDALYGTVVELSTDSRVFEAQDVQLHCFGINLAAIVEQDALAQPEHPRGEFLVGFPALSNARHDGALLVDIRQASVQRRSRMRDVILRGPVSLEASAV